MAAAPAVVVLRRVRRETPERYERAVMLLLPCLAAGWRMANVDAE
jgi:hypothetical protein